MAAEVGDVSVPESVYTDVHYPAIIIGGSSVLVALVLSTFLILQHLRHYTKPAEQKWIVGVLLMVPIYATESAENPTPYYNPMSFGFSRIISLWNPKLSLACDILRNCYEAIALYSFGSYLIACLGGERATIELLEDESRKVLLDSADEDQAKQHNSFLNFFCRPCVIGRDLFTIEKFGLVQYMILKTVCAFLALILELLGVYGDGEFKWNYGYPYIAVVLNFSQMWALYCLVQFYNVTHERLKPIKPLAKFISFKAIVFATWWQGFGIALLSTFGVLPKKGKLQTGLQDFLICIEMAIAAVAHVFVFSVRPYHFVPVAEYHEIVTETTTTEAAKLEKGGNEKPALLEKTESKVEVPGTSVTESVQDIIVEGGQTVVKDVVLTINQAIKPVEKGVTKIQETFHQKTVETEDGDVEEEVKETEFVRQDGNGSETIVSIEERVVEEDPHKTDRGIESSQHGT